MNVYRVGFRNPFTRLGLNCGILDHSWSGAAESEDDCLAPKIKRRVGITQPRLPDEDWPAAISLEDLAYAFYLDASHLNLQLP